MKALVIGGNGFIGSHLVDRLIENQWDVIVFDLHERRFEKMPPQAHFVRGDLTQAYLIREALFGVDVVFHLAWATIHEVANRDPAADVAANLIPSIHLIEACQQAGVKKFIFTSSGGTVYGPPQTLPIPENHIQNPITAYGITKLAVEKYLHMFGHLHGLDYVIFRPSVPYGPRQNPLGRQGAVAVFLHRAAHGLPISVWGDGSVVRDYFYVTDLVDALLAGAEQKLAGDKIFNIGGGTGVSLIQLLELVEKTVGKKPIVTFTPERKFDAPRIILDSSLAARKLNWQPNIDLEQGLSKTLEWMLATLD